MAVLALQLQMFCLIIIGVLVEKRGCIGLAGRKTLSDLLVYVILPCNILHSYADMAEIPAEFGKACLLIFGTSVLIHIASYFAGKLLFRNFSEEKKSVLMYGLLCCNSGFIGLPVVEALFGGLGVMYASVYMIPLRLVMWTIGVSLFTPITRQDAIRKVITNPCIICTFAGFILLLTPIELPTFLKSTMLAGSRCLVPIAMFVIGSILSSVPVKTLFSKTILKFSIIRLIVCPGVVLLALLPFHLDKMLVSICLLMSGMPAGTLASVLTTKYGGDTEFASRVIVTSTLLSTITIPMWMLVVNYVG